MSGDWVCNTCGAKPCTNPSFCRLCRIADRRKRPPLDPDVAFAASLMDESITLDQAYWLMNERRERRRLAERGKDET